MRGLLAQQREWRRALVRNAVKAYVNELGLWKCGGIEGSKRHEIASKASVRRIGAAKRGKGGGVQQ
jgi:hypothetical protein